ncbi:MAG: hypothetical protein UMV23_06415, partial [Halanaerobium sp.]|nr:hypothetical protein [Halanaerobium sp.]
MGLEGRYIKGSICRLLGLSFSYVGTLVGAGFASGREILNFFVLGYGSDGLKGALLAGLFLTIGGVIFLLISSRGLYDDILYSILGSRDGFLLDLIFMFMLWGSVLIMGAGGGSLFKEGLGLPAWIGLLITFMVMGFFACFGAIGVLRFNLFFTPFLVLFLLLLAGGFQASVTISGGVAAAGRGWARSSVLFSSYNLLFAFPALLALGKDIKDRKLLWGGGILGGALLTILLFYLARALLNGVDLTIGRDIPALILAGWLGRLGEAIFYITLWIALLSTGIVNLYTLISRLGKMSSYSNVQLVGLTLVICLPLSFLG